MKTAKQIAKEVIETWEVDITSQASPKELMFLLIDHYFRTHHGGYSRALFDILRFIEELWHPGEQT